MITYTAGDRVLLRNAGRSWAEAIRGEVFAVDRVSVTVATSARATTNASRAALYNTFLPIYTTLTETEAATRLRLSPFK